MIQLMESKEGIQVLEEELYLVFLEEDWVVEMELL